MKDTLTPKQERFCQAYVETGNASEAYRRVYDSRRMKPATVNRSAKELMDNPKISARIGDLRSCALSRHDVGVDRILGELALVAFASAGADRVKTSDKLRALELLGRFHGMWEGAGFMPPAGQDKGSDFDASRYDFSNVTLEEGTRMYQEMISHARLRSQEKPVKGARR